jgi:hypothetical protein
MKRRTLLSGLGLIAITKAVARAKNGWLPRTIRGEFAQTNAALSAAQPSGVEATLRASDKMLAGSGELIEAGAFRLDLLPFLRSGQQTHQFCSYDRAGDNYDAEYLCLYADKNGECVIFDAMGPGCLSRHQMNIWHDHQIYKGISIRYYFDDEETARVDMDVSTFFSEENPLGIFQPRLAFNGKERFRVLYHPMFFKKRLRVCLSSEPGGRGTVPTPWTGRYSDLPNRRNHWYNYTYQLYAEDPGLDSWTPQSARELMPSLLATLGTGSSGSDPKPNRGGRKIIAARKVEVNQTATFLRISSKAGCIAALRIKVDPANNVDALFSSWLKITFDHAPSPQIEAPIGCFFGAYRTSIESSYAALPLGFANGEGYCYFPMPFWKSALLQIENRGQRAMNVTAEVDLTSTSALNYSQEQCGYLHAHYHREDPRTEGKDYVYLETSGCGQVVGHVVMRWNTSMEEDERTYIDGSKTPWIIGEGFEDDHDMGWGLQNLTQPLFGAISAKGGAGGVYRFLLPDMYCFSSGIHYGHQTYGPHSPLGHEGMYQVGTEESVAFWYGVPHPRTVQTDEVDVGDPDSEATHGYRATGDVQKLHGAFWYDGEFNNVLFKTPAIADDGVSFTGESTFTVAISTENRGVRLRRRCDKENNRQQARVFVDGQLVTSRPWYSVDYEKTYRNIRWFDSDFEIPEAYTKNKSQVTVRVEFLSSKTDRWDEYHYWVYSHVTDAPRE